jgi:hypothetical protein
MPSKRDAGEQCLGKMMPKARDAKEEEKGLRKDV